MRYSITMIVLFAAAVLEVSGDAVMRKGVYSTSFATRLVFLLAGGIALAGYGYAVNRVTWDFGKLLGVYVAFFFIVAQLSYWIIDGRKPTLTIILGGILIIAGGYIVSRGQ